MKHSEHLKFLSRLTEAGPGLELLSDLLDEIAKQIDCERIFLFELRSSGGFRVLAARSHDREDIARPGERMSHFAVRRMAVTSMPVFVSDARRDRRYRPEEALPGKKMAISILVLPLSLRGELHGGIYADHRFQHLSRPTENDEKIAWLSAIMALALALRQKPKGARVAAKVASRAIDDEVDDSRAGPDQGGPAASRDVLGGERSEPEVFHELISANPDFRDVFDTIRSLSRSDLPVLVEGETGTGKGLVARALHDVSKRREKPFITFHCGAVPDGLIESELLGHVKGAFTGAESDHDGVFFHADGGTLFLDEVADMSPDVQKKLLRVLEDGKVRPVGAKSPIQLDVRILSSTSRDLERLVRDGGFRRDLYFRLKAVLLKVPPLRDRREDVLPLATHFLEKHAAREGRPTPRLDGSANQKLVRYSWPGNVREMENEMRRLVALGRPLVLADHLSIDQRGRRGHSKTEREGCPSLEDAVASAEREAILSALRAARGNKSRAASLLGITRKSLYRRMARYKIAPESP